MRVTVNGQVKTCMQAGRFSIKEAGKEIGTVEVIAPGTPEWKKTMEMERATMQKFSGKSIETIRQTFPGGSTKITERIRKIIKSRATPKSTVTLH